MECKRSFGKSKREPFAGGTNSTSGRQSRIYITSGSLHITGNVSITSNATAAGTVPVNGNLLLSSNGIISGAPPMTLSTASKTIDGTGSITNTGTGQPSSKKNVYAVTLLGAITTAQVGIVKKNTSKTTNEHLVIQPFGFTEARKCILLIRTTRIRSILRRCCLSM